MLLLLLLDVSYNQPKLSPCATWNPNAITFTDINATGGYPAGLFVDINNTVYVPSKAYHYVLIWKEGTAAPARKLSGGLRQPFSVFVSINGDVYVDNGYNNSQVSKWRLNATNSTSVLNVTGLCFGLFVDVYDYIYCSLIQAHQVVKQSYRNNPNITTTIAGNGTIGSSSLQLSAPRGIFVDLDLNLYVADSNNNRIQLFRSGQLTAMTLAGNGAPNTCTLYGPGSIVLDADGYMFITDMNNNRVVGSGPNGFRCIAGCTGVSGAATDQLLNPRGLSFDSYGNLYVVDGFNNRIQKFLLEKNSCGRYMNILDWLINSRRMLLLISGVSYNQPKLCPSATWTPDAITFSNRSTTGGRPVGVFVDINNTVYVPDKSNNYVLVWKQGNMTLARKLFGGLNESYSIFVSINGDIYVDNGRVNRRVSKWSLNATNSTSVLYVAKRCFGLFIDVYNYLYCSLDDLNQVVKQLNYGSPNRTKIVAGNGTIAGLSPEQLSAPRGIFVHLNLDLYVADSGNDRIQLFRRDQQSGTTLAGNGVPNTFTLDCPSAVVLDADAYIFVTDSNNNRIVGSGPSGFRCVAGCPGINGSASDQLSNPRGLSFDSFGNLYVADGFNDRIQKFLLATNSCGK